VTTVTPRDVALVVAGPNNLLPRTVRGR